MSSERAIVYLLIAAFNIIGNNNNNNKACIPRHVSNSHVIQRRLTIIANFKAKKNVHNVIMTIN